MNTLLAPTSAGIVGLFTRKYISSKHIEVRKVKWDVLGLLNGILCGLVAITASCAFVTDWGAIIIGAIAPIFYALTLRIYEKLDVDEP